MGRWVCGAWRFRRLGPVNPPPLGGLSGRVPRAATAPAGASADRRRAPFPAGLPARTSDAWEREVRARCAGPPRPPPWGLIVALRMLPSRRPSEALTPCPLSRLAVKARGPEGVLDALFLHGSTPRLCVRVGARTGGGQGGRWVGWCPLAPAGRGAPDRGPGRHVPTQQGQAGEGRWGLNPPFRRRCRAVVGKAF